VQRVSDLLQFKKKYGHCDVSQKSKKYRELATWLTHLRERKKRGTLTPQQFKDLVEIGIQWNPLERLWEELLSELEKFQKIHGHCDVPQNWNKNRKLGIWVSTQRVSYKKGNLAPYRIRKLEKIGFQWELQRAKLDVLWKKRVHQLEEFKEKHGHFNIPKRSSEYPGLSEWVNNIRQRKKRNSLMKERIYTLDRIGFIWDWIREKWIQRVSELEQFKSDHGHCNVPAKWPENRSLGGWVSKQRQQYKTGKLSEERIKRLEQLDFRW